MSSLGAGIPIGMSIGIGSGMAIGIGAGKKQTETRIETNIRNLASTHKIEVTGPGGTYLSLDEFITTVCAEEQNSIRPGSKKLIIGITIGLALVLFGGLVLFFLMRR